MDEQASSSYLAYLVRLWRKGEEAWRSTLENPHTGERLACANIEALLAFLRERTKERPSVNSCHCGEIT